MDWTHIHLKEVDSTNTYLKAHCLELPDRTMVSADVQTAGRGRLGRSWASPPGCNIYVSYLMKNIQDPFRATLVSSLGVIRTLRLFAPSIAFFVKWPNDIYVGDAKLAGVLSEYVPGGASQRGGVIAGMGINMNMTEAQLRMIDRRAVSLRSLTGCEYNLKIFLEKLAEQLEQCYISYSRNSERLFEEWKAENRMIGEVLGFTTSDGNSFDARILGINQDGGLELDRDGQRLSFSCGDVTVRRESVSNWVHKNVD